MIRFFKNFLFFNFFLGVLPMFWFLYEQEIVVRHIFFYYYIFFMYINYNFNVEEKSYLNIDLVYKFIYLFVKTPSFFFNYVFNMITKIYLYLIHIKYRITFIFLSLISNKYLSYFFICWRPLFKKTSYFGYFRSNRSKWIK